MDNFKIHFFNTIWSDLIILEKDNHFALVDTASAFYYPDIKEYFEELKIEKLDFIILTHFHSDHYGNIINILNDYKIDTLYFREYTNYELIGSDGKVACEEYNKKEKEKSDNIIKIAKEKTKLIIVDENLNEINFRGINIDIYCNKLIVKEMYENPSSPYYQERKFNDNYNSITLFIKINNHTIYLGGDATDSNASVDELKYLSSNAIKEIYKKYNINSIDIYKTAHHGGPGNNNLDLLTLINPKYAIITNTDKWLDNWSTYDNINKATNNECKILKTDFYIHIFDLSNDEIKLIQKEAESMFLKLKKD